MTCEGKQLDHISEIRVPSGKIVVTTGPGTVSKLCGRRLKM